MSPRHLRRRRGRAGRGVRRLAATVVRGRRAASKAGNAGLPFDAPSAPERIVAYTDGGARGNPGPAGYGVRIERPDGEPIEEFAGSIGVATNNVAEYSGLIAALEWAIRHGYRQLLVRSDSLLLVQQMLGNYNEARGTSLHAKRACSPASSVTSRSSMSAARTPAVASPRRYGRREGLIAAAIRPAPFPSRRYEHRRSG